MLHCVIAYPKDSILGQRLGNSLNMPYFSWPDCRSMQMFSLKLHIQYPYIQDWRHKLLVLLILFALLSFILLFLEPFKTGESPKMIVLGYSFMVVAAYLVVLLGEYIVFLYTQRWTLKYEACMLALFFMITAVAVYSYDIVVIKQHQYYWNNLGAFTFRVTLPFAIILLPILIAARRYYGNIVEHKYTHMVSIGGVVKSDILEVDQRRIVLIQSANNYVEVRYLGGDGKVCKQVVRSTLSKVHLQLPDFVKCHRSFLVNPIYISRLQGNQRRAYLIVYHVEEEIPVSKAYYAQVKSLS